MMRACGLAIGALLLAGVVARAEDDKVYVERAEDLSEFYEPDAEPIYYAEVQPRREKGFMVEWPPESSMASKPGRFQLSGPAGRKVGWFGIVRGILENQRANETELLIEGRYCDYTTDEHQQVVSLYGPGDFRAVVPGTGYDIPRLSLVVVYGTTEGAGGPMMPTVRAEYVRWWDWGQFAFVEYGEDRTSPAWRHYRKPGALIYSPTPEDEYYESLLGERTPR